MGEKKQHLEQYEHYRCQAEVVATQRSRKTLAFLVSRNCGCQCAHHHLHFHLTSFHRRLRTTILWVTNRDLGISFPKGTPRLYPRFHTSVGQQQKRVLPPRSGDKVRQLHRVHHTLVNMICMHVTPLQRQCREDVGSPISRWDSGTCFQTGLQLWKLQGVNCTKEKNYLVDKGQPPPGYNRKMVNEGHSGWGHQEFWRQLTQIIKAVVLWKGLWMKGNWHERNKKLCDLGCDMNPSWWLMW